MIAISPPVAGELIKLHRVESSRVRTIYNAVDFQEIRTRYQTHQRQRVRQRYHIPADAFLFGNIARLVPGKGQEYLIRALALVRKHFPEAYLLIAGEGRSKRSLEALVKTLRLEEGVRLIGSVREVTEPLAAMDAFVFPAVWREGFGFSIVEAMAVGKPVITTDIWALNTMIESGVDGFLVPPKNEGKLAEQMIELLRDPSIVCKIAENGKKRVEQFFASPRMIEEVESLYSEVLRNKGGKG